MGQTLAQNAKPPFIGVKSNIFVQLLSRGEEVRWSIQWELVGREMVDVYPDRSQKDTSLGIPIVGLKGGIGVCNNN